eukprot:gene7576-10324_t
MECKVVIHGGAGVIQKTLESSEYRFSLKNIITKIHQHLSINEINPLFTAVDVVEFAVNELENDPLFNAGRGAVLTSESTHEMECSIMDGREGLKCGAASLIKTVKNPISVARLVMEQTKHNYLVGSSVEALAVEYGLEIVPNSYFTVASRQEQLQIAKRESVVSLDHHLKLFGDYPGSLGTVGCVCYLNGNLAAATSTGGMTNKMTGRVGDSPIIGAGTYACNLTCAISATGKGEDFMRYCAAYDVHARMDYGGKTLIEAMKETLFEKLPIGSGGLIGVDKDGNVGMEFNSLGMFRGMLDYSKKKGSLGIWEEEEYFDL